MSSFIQQAFDVVIKDSIKAEGWFVCLIELRRFYGGPEEGGWWGTDSDLVAYKEFATEDLATAASEAVHKFAVELQQQSRRDYGDQCLKEMDWLEKRGLEADFLPEPDGPTEYSVRVCQELPEPYREGRHYE